MNQNRPVKRKILGAITSVFEKFANLFQRKSKLFKSFRVEDFPDALNRSTLYLATGGKNLRAAALICPCGCGDIIELNLLAVVRPRWEVIEHPKGLVSLTPSVKRLKGCRSHFWIRRGQVHWC